MLFCVLLYSIIQIVNYKIPIRIREKFVDLSENDNQLTSWVEFDYVNSDGSINSQIFMHFNNLTQANFSFLFSDEEYYKNISGFEYRFCSGNLPNIENITLQKNLGECDTFEKIEQIKRVWDTDYNIKKENIEHKNLLQINFRIEPNKNYALLNTRRSFFSRLDILGFADLTIIRRAIVFSSDASINYNGYYSQTYDKNKKGYLYEDNNKNKGYLGLETEYYYIERETIIIPLLLSILVALIVLFLPKIYQELFDNKLIRKNKGIGIYVIQHQLILK